MVLTIGSVGKKFLEKIENEHIITQKLWDTVKAVLRGKFIAIQTYLKKIEKSQPYIYNHISTRTTGTTAKPRVNRRKELISEQNSMT